MRVDGKQSILDPPLSILSRIQFLWSEAGLRAPQARSRTWACWLLNFGSTDPRSSTLLLLSSIVTTQPTCHSEAKRRPSDGQSLRAMVNSVFDWPKSRLDAKPNSIYSQPCRF